VLLLPLAVKRWDKVQALWRDHKWAVLTIAALMGSILLGEGQLRRRLASAVVIMIGVAILASAWKTYGAYGRKPFASALAGSYINR
jgi:hypothetical protein